MSAYQCRDCGQTIAQQEEKALSGEVQVVWISTVSGEWVCTVTGEEHEPGTPNRPVEVSVKYGPNESFIRLSLAEAGNFIFRPIIEALDDGDASWQLQEDDPERLSTIAHWASGLYKVTEH